MNFSFDTMPHFDKAMRKLLKKKPHIWKALVNALILLSQDPGPTSLRVHKLDGYMKDHWSFSLAHDLRVIYRRQKGKIILINIGSHDEVYW